MSDRRALRCGVFGVGALGRHHTRILGDLPGVERVGVHDPRPEAAETAAREFGARVFASFGELAAAIDAAVVAAPTREHEPLTLELLDRGVHVLVEKPIAPDLEAADRMIAAAERGGRILAVGHVEYHNPAVATLLETGGAPGYVEVQRLGVFSPRSLDVDVVLDLMIHDLQILHALDRSDLVEVRATGIPVLSERIDIANARVELASGLVANLTTSRVSSERVRKLRAFYGDRYASLDYQAQELKGFRLDRAGSERRILPDDRPVERAEPLRRELEAFVAACRGEPNRSVGGAEARRALATALAVAAAAGRRGART
jgi:predicted dehydrogenase